MKMNQFSKRKFGDIDIKELICQYRLYECLWNINSPEYKQKFSKQRAWLDIAHHFQKPASEVKRKIQYLRTAYVHEKRKVDASKKSGSKPYKPSLFYYKELDFLNDMVIWRKFNCDRKTNNLCFENVQISANPEENDEFIASENKEDDYLKEPEINCKTEQFCDSDLNVASPMEAALNSSPVMSNSRTSVSRTEKQKNISKVESNSTVLRKHSSFLANKPETKHLYISFGKTIALQLQHLPLEVAIVTMSEIHTILTNKTLEYISSLKKQRNSPSISGSDEIYDDIIEEAFDDSI